MILRCPRGSFLAVIWGPRPKIRKLISFRTSTETLRRKFERYGDVGDAYIPRDRHTGG